MTVWERPLFFTDFAASLLRTNPGALPLVIDEAHLFAPKGKVNDPRSGKMVGAANNLVSLGRGIGLRIILISQRPAKVHNDCLAGVETLAIGLPERPPLATSTRALLTALNAAGKMDVSLIGPVEALLQAAPELAAGKSR